MTAPSSVGGFAPRHTTIQTALALLQSKLSTIPTAMPTDALVPGDQLMKQYDLATDLLRFSRFLRSHASRHAASTAHDAAHLPPGWAPTANQVNAAIDFARESSRVENSAQALVENMQHLIGLVATTM